MANELVASLPLSVWRRANGPVNDLNFASSGSYHGLRLLKSDTEGYTAMFTLGEVGTLNATYSVRLAITDTGLDANDLGKVVRLGVTVKLIADGETMAIGTSGGTEVEASGTLDTTTGEIELVTIASVGLDSMTEPTMGLIRVRRIGTAATDTCQNEVLLAHVDIINA